MSIQQLLLCDKPKVVPGSKTYNPGTHTFSVPLFNTLTVELWGGGGGSGKYEGPFTFLAGANGEDSSVASLNLFARGGKGSTDGKAPGQGGTASGGSTNTTGGNSNGGSATAPPSAPGSGGIASTNPYTSPTGGSAANGGAGGAGTTYELPFFIPPGFYNLGNPGGQPGGGQSGDLIFYRDDALSQAIKVITAAGGGGGYCARTYTAAIGAAVQYNDQLAVIVGSGAYNPSFGTVGGDGRVKFTWS